jgi:hypothetical protein
MRLCIVYILCKLDFEYMFTRVVDLFCTKLICNIHRYRINIWIQMTIIVGWKNPTFYDFNCVFFSACGGTLGKYFSRKCLTFTICNKAIYFYSNKLLPLYFICSFVLCTGGYHYKFRYITYKSYIYGKKTVSC